MVHAYSKVGAVFLFFMTLIVLTSCGGGEDSAREDRLSTKQALTAVNPASPYASVLEGCVKASTSLQFCTFSKLPLLSQSSSQSLPSMDEIMDRTVVSHDWMGVRFREVLERMPDDMRFLLGGITAIVIASDINPSFFSGRTGAISLNPRGLWLTNEEKATIDKKEDYRSNFSDELKYRTLSRYVIGNERARLTFSLDGTETRTIDDIVLPMANLLFHELAHANDFFPPESQHLLSLADSADQSRQLFAGQKVSDQLDAQQPLRSQTLIDLARVRFQGDKASEDQKLLLPADLGLEFETDGAMRDYAYSTSFEDVAVLFQTVMMKYHFNTDLEFAFTDAPADLGSRNCADYIVRWGVRHRLGNPLVKIRAEIAVQRLLNITDSSSYFDDLPAPLRMEEGVDFCAQMSSPPTSETNNKIFQEESIGINQISGTDLIDHGDGGFSILIDNKEIQWKE